MCRGERPRKGRTTIGDKCDGTRVSRAVLVQICSCARSNVRVVSAHVEGSTIIGRALRLVRHGERLFECIFSRGCVDAESAYCVMHSAMRLIEEHWIALQLVINTHRLPVRFAI